MPVGHVVSVGHHRDMVRLQKMLIDHLGIPRLLGRGRRVDGRDAGARMGGDLSGKRGARAMPIATTARHSAQQIAFNEVGRQAIMADPDWNERNYYGGRPPGRGLAVARMVGHITYMSDETMREKFGGACAEGESVDSNFEVESYLQYRGSKFVDRLRCEFVPLHHQAPWITFDLTERGSLVSGCSNA